MRSPTTSVAQATARDWLAVLEASYIVFRLPPYHTNFGKRRVKTPKLTFHDTGLAAWLLGVATPEAMNIHPMRGALFENMLVAEYGKHCRNQGHANTMYFWRDNTGNEGRPVDRTRGRTVARRDKHSARRFKPTGFGRCKPGNATRQAPARATDADQRSAGEHHPPGCDGRELARRAGGAGAGASLTDRKAPFYCFSFES